MRILWATKKGDPVYLETVLTEKEELFEQALTWGTKNGYDRFRVSDIDMTQKPDFIKTIQK